MLSEEQLGVMELGASPEVDVLVKEYRLLMALKEEILSDLALEMGWDIFEARRQEEKNYLVFAKCRMEAMNV